MSSEMTVYYMEKEEQFWEITVEGTESRIRYGKISKPGRKCPPKHHKTANQATLFAKRQVNARIINEWIVASTISSAAKLMTFASVKRAASLKRAKAKSPEKETGTTKKAWRSPPKKSETVRRLSRQDTLQLTKPTTPSQLSKKKTVSIKPAKRKTTFTKRQSKRASVKEQPGKIRKPHKKQTTVRRIAKILEKAEGELAQEKAEELPSALAKAYKQEKLKRGLSKRATVRVSSSAGATVKRAGSLARSGSLTRSMTQSMPMLMPFCGDSFS